MVEKQKKFSKTRCCIRIINLTASICFVITPILRIMYKGFPAFETIDDNLNVFDFLSHPLPLESPKNIRRQVYMVVKQVPTFQKAILHKIITSKVTLMCVPNEGLYSMIKRMEIFKTVQDVVVLHKFQNPIPVMGVLKGPNWYILIMRVYCLALEKGNLLTREWFILNARYVAWLEQARPVFSIDCGLYVPIWSDLLKGLFNYLSFLTLTSYVCLRYNLECLEWLLTKGKSVTNDTAIYFITPIKVFLDRTKNFKPSLYLILKDTIKIIGSKYHEYIKESFPILIEYGQISLVDLRTLHSKILPILQKELLLCINMLTKIGLTNILKANLILLNHLLSKTKIISRLCSLKIRYTPICLKFLYFLTLEVRIVCKSLLNMPIFVTFLSTQMRMIIKYVEASNLTIMHLYTPINIKSISNRINVLSKQSQFVIEYLRYNTEIIHCFLLKENKLQLVIKYLKTHTEIISYSSKIKNIVREFIKIKTPLIKEYIKVEMPILIHGFHDNSQVLISFLRRIPIIRIRSKYRHLTDPGIVDFIGSIAQIELDITNFIIGNTLIFVEFIKAQTSIIIKSIILDVPRITQFIILDTPTTLEFIKVELPGINDLLIKKTNFRVRREFLQRNSRTMGVLVLAVKALSLRFIVKMFLRSYLLILLAEIYLVLGDQSPLIFILNNMVNIGIPTHLLPIFIKVSLCLFDVSCEVLAVWIFLFLGISFTAFVVEPYIVYKLGLKYAPEIIKLPAYRVFMKHIVFYYAEYLGFFKIFPISDINGIIKNG